METNFPNSVIYVANHDGGSTDPFDTNETEARAGWYGVTGVPTVWIDGKYNNVGGGNGCNAEYNLYLADYNQRMNETSGVSPVDITGFFTVGQSAGTLQATFHLVDQTNLGSVQGTLFIYEDDITWCCGYGNINQWDDITRVIYSEPVTLAHQGDTATIIRNVNFDSGWNPANMHAVAILQQTSNPKTIIQAARLTYVVDFALNMPKHIASVPGGNGSATYTSILQNVSNRSDVLSLSVDQAMGWPTDFQIAGDPNWYTSHNVTLAAGANVGVTVRVQTDATKRIGTGTFSITSANSGRTEPCVLRLFNHSYAIMLVDNDNNQTWGTGGPTCETPFVNALNNLGYLYDNWDAAGDHTGVTPALNEMAGFDVVVWETGYYTASPVNTADIQNLEAYLNLGGHLYMDSMDLFAVQGLPADFLSNYLGIASYTYRNKAHTDTGVSGDPITDGMVLPLTWFSGDQPNRVSALTPTADANAILISETNHPNAVRHATSTFRVVYNSIIENAISDSNPDPNNNQTLIGRIIQWLVFQPSDAVPPVSGAGAARILAASPNPFSNGTELRFSLGSAAAGSNVRLSLVDASGRVVRTLVNGSLPAGAHTISWDGRDDRGRAVGAGVFFARLQSADGSSSQKLVLMK